MPIEYLIALITGFFYAVGAVLSKRAFQGGVGVARTTVLFNWIMCLCFLPFLAFVKEAPNWSHLHWPVITGLTFFLGQVTTFIAIRMGHVSVQAPVMGTKMVFVALFASLLGTGTIPLSWWIASCLSMLGIFLLSLGKLQNRHHILAAVIMAMLSSALFGITDVIVAEHSRHFSLSAYAPLMMFVNAALSLIFVPFFKAGFRDVPRDVWPFFAGGGLVFGVQAVMLYWALGHFGNAVPINILYSSRGVWGVILIWVIGHWFANRESKDAGHRIMFIRFSGALLMMGAILLVLAE